MPQGVYSPSSISNAVPTTGAGTTDALLDQHELVGRERHAAIFGGVDSLGEPWRRGISFGFDASGWLLGFRGAPPVMPVPRDSSIPAPQHLSMSQKLQELLLQSRAITEAQLRQALEDATKTRKSLAQTILDLHFVDESRFAQWVSRASETRLVDPVPEDAVATLERRLPRATARQCEVVPVHLEGRRLHVVMTDPLDRAAIALLEATSGYEIVPVTGVRSSIERLVNRFYSEDVEADMTILPSPVFDLDLAQSVSSTPEGKPLAEEPPEKEPFDLSNETLIASRRSLTLFDEATAPEESSVDTEFDTMMLKPAAPPVAPPPSDADATNPTDPLVLIARRLDQLADAMQKIQRRLDAIDATLARVINR